MKNNDFHYLNNEIEFDEEIKEEQSEETEDEIIENYSIEEDDDEYIDQNEQEKQNEIEHQQEEQVEQDEEEEGQEEQNEQNFQNGEELAKSPGNKNNKKPIMKKKNNKVQKKNNIKEEKYNKNSKENNKNKINTYSNITKNTQIEINKPKKNKFQEYYSPKFDFAKKKHKKTEEIKTPDELFVKAFEKNKLQNEKKKEIDQEGNTLSTKVTDILYDKYIGQNGNKVKNLDVISKMKDEEVRVNREALRTKDDAKKINNMINRQEDFEKYKENKLNERVKKINDKFNEEYVFMPNGINSSSRSPSDFYNSQLKFIEKKEDNINQIYQNIRDDENRKMNINMTSKMSEKIASAKNPNESIEDFCKRLHYEKLKTVKESYEKPKEEKKLTKEQVNILSNKLYKDGQTFRDNKDKKQREKMLRDMNNKKEELISEKSNKVLLDKFISYYDKILMDIFNRNDNFQICFDEYKLILNNMGCINPNSQIDEGLVKESFNNYLNPKEDKIDTYSFLIFGLTFLGIYKGNDEQKIQKNNSNIVSDNINNINNNNNNNNNNNISNNISNNINNSNNINKDIENQKKNIKNNKKSHIQKPKNKTSSEIIKMYLPTLDLNQYGYSNKVAKIIKQKFLPFVKGLNNAWIVDNSKKKQERREKLEESLKRDENKKSNRLKKNIKKEYNSSNENKNEIIEEKYSKNSHENSKHNSKSNKLEDVYQIIQQKKENDLRNLKAKKEAEELALCTFSPKINKPNKAKKNKNQIRKNIEKLYQEGKAAYIQKRKLVDRDPEDNDENKINCTFKPVIRQYNNEMFSKNPLKEDMQKFEKIREQKLSSIKEYEYEKPMNFAIESKINKEDIIDRVIPDRNNSRNEFTQEENNREDVPPMLKVEVNLDEKNHTDKIIIYPGDNVREKTIQFCLKHKLNEEKKNTLLNIILEKMKENKENENNEEIYENIEDEDNNDNIENEIFKKDTINTEENEENEKDNQIENNNENQNKNENNEEQKK